MSDMIKALLIKFLNMYTRYLRGIFISLFIAAGMIGILKGSFSVGDDLALHFMPIVCTWSAVYAAIEAVKYTKRNLPGLLLIIICSAFLALITLAADELLISCYMEIPAGMLILTVFFLYAKRAVSNVFIERYDILVKDPFLAAKYNRESGPFDAYLLDDEDEY